VQVIADGRAVDMQVVDLTAWPEPERAAELQRRLEQEARCPFDLARDLMLRATLFRLAHTEHALSLTMHHIASDGWSMGVLFQEVAELYEAFTRETPSRLPPLPIQYADYALWQRRCCTASAWRLRSRTGDSAWPAPRPSWTFHRPAATDDSDLPGARESLTLPGR